jgi:hypothetical protein
VPALAQDKSHWLVGTWQGSFLDHTGRDGSARTLVVKSVNADGTVDAGWAATGTPKIGNATVKVSGDNVTVKTSEGSTVEIARTGDGVLRGSFQSANARKPRAIELRKQ